jgi:hypothetical protein
MKHNVLYVTSLHEGCKMFFRHSQIPIMKPIATVWRDMAGLPEMSMPKGYRHKNMSCDWEATFRSWGSPPSETEQTKCENAERAIRKAIAASSKLSAKPIEVFTQGSYANRTNVRQDSDVDICILYTGAFFPDYSLSLSDGALGYSEGTYPYEDFRTDVEEALIDYFGGSAITRGNKAFDIHENTYRIDADAVPCFEHRRYIGIDSKQLLLVRNRTPTRRRRQHNQLASSKLRKRRREERRNGAAFQGSNQNP